MDDTTTDRARFKAITESTREDWQLIGGELERFAERLPERLVAHLADKPAMLLRNHGTLTLGRTVAEAYVLMATLLKACEIQIQAQTCGAPLVVPATG